jgi:O-methyltransferase involved in polyketide biosynthesis
VSPLTAVSETLVISLYARALETELEHAIVSDPDAVEILERLAPDLSRFKRMWVTQVATAMRTEILDQAAAAFIERVAQPVVVELGAGLSTRPFRLADERVRWIAVDLAGVEPLWRELIGETGNRRFVCGSVLESGWDEALQTISPDRVLFIAEGLLMYFQPPDVRALISLLATRFGGSELLFDALGPLMAVSARLHPAVSKTNAAFGWGIRDVRAMERWHPAISVVAQWRYLDRHRERWGWLATLRHVRTVASEMKAAQLRFLPGDHHSEQIEAESRA